MLYVLYLAELLNADTVLQYGYTDNINIYKAFYLLDKNIQLLAEDVRSINA